MGVWASRSSLPDCIAVLHKECEAAGLYRTGCLAL
jgi:hypothetical protein